MKVLISLVKGFLAMAGIIMIYCAVTLVRAGESWLGLLYLIILALPFSYFVVLWRGQKRIGAEVLSSTERWKRKLFALEGTALACWAFDISTTYYAINVTRLAAEANPLGWPFGIVGALVFYAPTFVFSYYLIARKSDKLSLYAGFVLSLLVVHMGLMNFAAGAQNFVFFLDTVSLSEKLGIPLLILVVFTDLVFTASKLLHFEKGRIMRSKLRAKM